MIGEIWHSLRGREKTEQGRLDQLERLAELHLKAEYRYPCKDLAGLVQCHRDAGLGVRLHISGFARPLPVPVRDAGYEILEEALANVVKHGAGTAEVIVGYEPGRLTLRVDNPMPGRTPEARGPRNGLKRMRRCASRVGGSFGVGPYACGWRVRAELPIRRSSWKTAHG